MSDYSVDALAAALQVSRRTIERAIEDGQLTPQRAAEGNRARALEARKCTFSSASVAELRERAAAARAIGLKYIMRAILADGPVNRAPKYVPEPRLSPQAFIARVLWKRHNTFRRQKSQEPNSD